MEFKTLLAALSAMTLAACSTAPTLGGGKTDTSSAVGGTSAQNANSQLEHCDASLGTLGIDEDQSAPWYLQLSQYQLPSTVPVLRLMIQQSNCFVIVERGKSLNNVMNERSLAQSGEMRSGSNMGKGQMVAADYTMSPTITFAQKTGGGVAGLGGLVPGMSLVTAAVGSFSTNSASTTLLLIDNRSSVQLSASQGSAKNWDIGGLGGMFGGGVGGAAGAYSNTPQGKIITAAFMDSYNQMVRSLRSYQAQSVKGGLGTGGTLGVSGGSTPASQKVGQ
jgi:hypothetical protein